MSTPTVQIRDAGPPFAAPDADIILRSIDGVNFRTRKDILVRNMHGFGEILRDGQLHGLGSNDEVQGDLPVLPLPESSAVLDFVLRTLLPVELGCPPLSDDVNTMAGACKAFSKYIAHNFPASLYSALLHASAKAPEHVYASTCRFSALTDITKAAAKHSLANPHHLDDLPLDVVIEMDVVQYRALAMYQKACRAAAMEASTPDFMKSTVTSTPGIEYQAQCRCRMCDDPIYIDYVPGPQEDPDNFGTSACLIPVWLVKYLGDVHDALANGPRICGAVALDEKHLAAAIDASRDCPGCSKEVAKFLGFAHELVEWIDEAIAKVNFEGNAVIDA